MSAEILFYFDYASPWSYLANAIYTKKLPGIRVSLQPVFVRGFESFATGLPYGAAKMEYLARDFVRCTEHEGVPVAPPLTFPMNGLHALRGALVAEREGKLAEYHAAMFDAAWRESREVSTKESVIAIARAIGLAAIADGLDDPWAKNELRARTDAAAARGIFGVPTFVVGDELFWGHDRLDYVARAAARS